MELFEAFEKRRSCRKYKDKDLDKEYVAVVLNAGRLAPSTGNLQDRSFVLVRNKGKRLYIAEACGGQMWMQFAPVHIVVVADNKKTKQFYGIRGERFYSIQDCALSIQNMLLAATDLGIGSCVVSAFDEDKLKRILNMPDPARPQAVITLGYCAEEPETPIKYRLEKFVWIEEYGNKVENIAVFLGAWSTIIEQKTKKLLEKANIPEKKKMLIEKLKEHGKKLKEKMTKKP